MHVQDLKTTDKSYDFLTEECMGVIHQDIAQQADAFEITVAVKRSSHQNWRGVRTRILDAILWPLAGIQGRQPDIFDTHSKRFVLKGVTVDLRNLPTRAWTETPV